MKLIEDCDSDHLDLPAGALISSLRAAHGGRPLWRRPQLPRFCDANKVLSDALPLGGADPIQHPHAQPLGGPDLPPPGMAERAAMPNPGSMNGAGQMENDRLRSSCTSGARLKQPAALAQKVPLMAANHQIFLRL